MNFFLFIGAFLGFLSVAFGALAEHKLKATIPPGQFVILMKALNYHQLYSVLIVSLALCSSHLPKTLYQYIKLAAWLFLIGMLLFSFSIYFAVIFDNKSLLHAAPIGGVALMIAWVILILATVRRTNIKSLIDDETHT